MSEVTIKPEGPRLVEVWADRAAAVWHLVVLPVLLGVIANRVWDRWVGLAVFVMVALLGVRAVWSRSRPCPCGLDEEECSRCGEDAA